MRGSGGWGDGAGRGTKTSRRGCLAAVRAALNLHMSTGKNWEVLGKPSKNQEKLRKN